MADCYCLPPRVFFIESQDALFDQVVSLFPLDIPAFGPNSPRSPLALQRS